MACRASLTASACDVVAVAAQAIAQDDGVDAVVVEEGHEVGALAADVQRVVPAAGGQDHDRAGVQAAIDRVDFDDGLWMLTMLLIRPGTVWLMLYFSASRTRPP